MSSYFLDTSSLIKQHVDELGYLWVRALCDPSAGNTIIVSEAAIIEVIASLCRMVRENPPRLNLADRDMLITVFETLVQQQYVVIEVNRTMFIRAATLCRTHALRAYDAVQLACALTYRDDTVTSGQPAVTFICADNMLLTVAAQEGLAVDNPNLHP